MFMDAIKELIRPELLILIPVLYFIGIAIKNTKAIADNYIPLLLGVIGIVLATIYVIATTPMDSSANVLQMLFVGVTQGVLCSGCCVYVNQIIKQNQKGDDDT